MIDQFCNIIFKVLNYYLSKNLQPDLIISDIKELSSDNLDDLITQGIKGFIMDLDETLRFNCKDIPECNQKWLQMAKTKLKIIVLSNGYCQNTERYLKKVGINYLGLAYKPLKISIIKAIKDLNLSSDEIFMIGDDYFCDIYGGSRNKLKTILVNNRLKKLNDNIYINKEYCHLK